MTQVAVAAPGLYVRGREAAELPVARTAVTAFVGIGERGPIGIPQPLRGFGDYLEVFGGFVDYGHLAQAVYAFFQNGGEKCWVVRASGPDPADLHGGCPTVEPLAVAVFPDLNDRDGVPTLGIAAIDAGSWGNEIAFAIGGESTRDMELTKLRTPVGPTGFVLPVESVLDISPGAEVGLSAADDPLVSRRYEVQSVDAINLELTLDSNAGATFPAGSVVSGRGFRLEVRQGDRLEVFDQLSMTAGHPRHFVEIVNGPAEVTSYVEKRERGHSILVRVADVPGGAAKPAQTPPLDDESVSPHKLTGGGDGFRGAWIEVPASGPGTMRLASIEERGTAGHELRVGLRPFASSTALPVPILPGPIGDRVVVEDSEGFAVGDDLTLEFTAADGSQVSETQPIAVIDAQNGLLVAPAFTLAFPVGARASVADRFDITVYRGGDLEPIEPASGQQNPLRNLSGDPAHARWYVTRIATLSNFLCAPDPGGIVVPESVTLALVDGVDPGMIDYRNYTGYEPDGSQYGTQAVGLATLEEVEDVGLVAVPDLHRVDADDYARGQTDLLHHCARVDGRFAILDPPPSSTVVSIESWPLEFPDARLAKYGALYFPWVSGLFEGEVRSVPPCGFVAGRFASSDRRRGVGKAPANDAWKGAVDLAIRVDREAQHVLDPIGVNCIRKFDDGEVRLFGARTLSRDPRFVHVNVRRVVLSVIKTLRQSLLWAVFEPNGAELRRRITSSLTGYLGSLVAKGLTASAQAGESFYVKCDGSNNPREVEDRGELVAEIGLAVAAPAEFIVLIARRSPDALEIVEEDV